MYYRSLLSWLAAVILIALAPNNVLATTIAFSDFDAGLDGWFTAGDGVSSHQPTGGNPNGFLQSVDQPTGLNTDAFAPSKFLGDWSALDGQGFISVDFKMISACCAISEGMEFWISGPGGSASRRLPISEGPFFQWTTYTIDLVESEWNISRGSWGPMLENIDTLRFDMEHVARDETTGLDNVLLAVIPEPSTVFLVLAGTLRLSLHTRRSTKRAATR